jgi:2,3-bisphosphoglycerate-independent phosphoglycerate mutase
VDDHGVIIDRRAGRISTETCEELTRLLGQIEIDGAEIIVLPVAEHRFALVLRGQNLFADLARSDPGYTGEIPPPVAARSQRAGRTAQIVNQFISRARDLLAEKHPANMVITRGYSSLPQLPKMPEVYKLNPLAIASYPLYRGVARLVGMQVVSKPKDLQEEIEQLQRYYDDFDFFFVHAKYADTKGEDGDFDAKVAVLEEIDSHLKPLADMSPEALIIAGDHSTPAVLSGHSWHPVPFTLVSPWGRVDSSDAFSESACARGCLGTFPAMDVMPLAMAHALKLTPDGLAFFRTACKMRRRPCVLR